MKKLLLFLLLPTFAFAQDWAPIGAKWTYSLSTINPNYKTYATFESVSDTIFAGKTCKKMVYKAIYPTMTFTDNHYMYSDSNRVYHYDRYDSVWYKLYDFSLSVGDTFHLPQYNMPGTIGWFVTVIAVDTIIINGQQRKRLEYSGGDLGYSFYGKVIEGIGNPIDMFPIPDLISRGPLRCYEDSSLGLYKNLHTWQGPWTLDCDVILTNVEEETKNQQIKVFPNPFQNEVTFSVDNSDQTILTLYNLLGKQILQQTFSNTTTVSTSNLDNGVYLYELKNANGSTSVGKVIKQ